MISGVFQHFGNQEFEIHGPRDREVDGRGQGIRENTDRLRHFIEQSGSLYSLHLISQRAEEETKTSCQPTKAK